MTRESHDLRGASCEERFCLLDGSLATYTKLRRPSIPSPSSSPRTRTPPEVAHHVIHQSHSLRLEAPMAAQTPHASRRLVRKRCRLPSARSPVRALRQSPTSSPTYLPTYLRRPDSQSDELPVNSQGEAQFCDRNLNWAVRVLVSRGEREGPETEQSADD